MSILINAKTERLRRPDKEQIEAVERMYALNPGEVFSSEAFDLIDLEDERAVHNDYESQLNTLLRDIADRLNDLTDLVDSIPSEDINLSIYRDSNASGGKMNPLCIAAAAAAYHYWQCSDNDKLGVLFDSNYHLNQVLQMMIDCAYYYWRKSIDELHTGTEGHDDILERFLRAAPFYSGKANSEFTIAAIAAYCSGFYSWRSMNKPAYDLTNSRYDIVRQVSDGSPNVRCCFCGTEIGDLVHAQNHIKYVLGWDDRKKYGVDALPLLQEIYICQDCAEQAAKQLSEHRATKHETT